MFLTNIIFKWFSFNSYGIQLTRFISIPGLKENNYVAWPYVNTGTSEVCN